jgi:tripartite-type tricarboxylate transporter receptor subunit TctC
MAEAGMADFDVNLWLGLFVPASTPDDICDKLNTAVRQALANDELKAAFAKVGIEPEGLSRTDSKAFVSREFKKWAEVIKTANIVAE